MPMERFIFAEYIAAFRPEVFYFSMLSLIRMPRKKDLVTLPISYDQEFQIPLDLEKKPHASDEGGVYWTLKGRLPEGDIVDITVVRMDSISDLKEEYFDSPKTPAGPISLQIVFDEDGPHINGTLPMSFFISINEDEEMMDFPENYTPIEERGLKVRLKYQDQIFWGEAQIRGGELTVSDWFVESNPEETSTLYFPADNTVLQQIWLMIALGEK
jgi:hypothetical protein